MEREERRERKKEKKREGKKKKSLFVSKGLMGSMNLL